jgi:ABC-type sugar transport system ATPase subunit
MIEFAGISITLGRFEMREISFRIPTGGYGVLMGSSGSGKTTLVEILCGLRKQDSGRILLHGKDHSQSPPGKREIGYVPQDGALFPTMDVFQNLAFAPSLRRWTAGKIKTAVEGMSESLGITHLLSRRIQFLSGGEKQRVALGRALLAEPKILCLDEPLAALDETTHERMVVLLKKIHQSTGTTVLHITHRSSEARELSDHLLHLQNGELVQNTGSKEEPVILP